VEDRLDSISLWILILEAPDRESLNPWIGAWDDLVDFEVIPVQASAEFWATA
jgi:hypothetical protein